MRLGALRRIKRSSVNTNWSPATVPTGTAIFGASTVTSIVFPASFQMSVNAFPIQRQRAELFVRFDWNLGELSFSHLHRSRYYQWLIRCPVIFDDARQSSFLQFKLGGERSNH